MAGLNSPALRKLMSTVLAILLLLYVGYQIYNMRHTKILTATADTFTASESVQVSGIALRNETVLKSGAGGVVDYVLDSGDKVAKGGTVALVFNSTDQASAHRQLESVQSELTKLQNLQTPGNTFAANPDTLNGQIGRGLAGILSKTVTGDFGGITDSRDSLFYLMNEKQMVAGNVSNFNSRIQSLQQQQATLTKQAGQAKGSVLSPASGYFIRSVDGMEGAVSYASVPSLSAGQVKAAQGRKAESSSAALGKVCGDYGWYFAFTVPSSRAAEFRKMTSGGTVSIHFPFVSSEAVPAVVEEVNQTNEAADAAVILKCTYMDAALASLRNESAQVILNEYTGIRVGKDTVHFATVTKTVKGSSGKPVTQKKEVRGVYVINGSMIKFRQIFPLYSTDSYVVCDPSPPKEDLMTEETIKLHDEVVVEGTDLYDGKVIG